MPRIGFVLLTHQHPAQILRLVRRLGASFEGAPIACHHDFGRCQLDPAEFPPEVRFVRPHVATRWGDFSLVEATMAALQTLYSGPSAPDWFALISGADYPLKCASAVLRDLEAGGADVYMQSVWIRSPRPANDAPSGPRGYAPGEGPLALGCFKRYYRRKYSIPLPGLAGRWRSIPLSISVPWLVRRFAPYDDAFRCYAGSQWLSANARAAEYVLEWSERNAWFADYLRGRFAPDETYLHTILGNAPDLRVANQDFRYIDWSARGANPRVLGIDDLEAMLASGAHFARKFAPDAPVLDQIDALLDSRAAKVAS